MNCGFDLGCYLGTWTAPVVTFWNTWDWLAWFIAGLILGGILGWRMVLGILTLGIAYLLYRRFQSNDTEPDYETGDPPKPKPKKRGF